MLTTSFLVTFGVLARLAIRALNDWNPALNLWNAAPLGAISLYAGARLPRRYAVAVPLVLMVVADLILQRGDLRYFASYGLLTSYATLVLIALLGRLPRRDAGAATRVGMSVGASTLFFLTTNFAVWATGAGSATSPYPATLSGLAACYTLALPFYVNSLAGDLAGTALLFGVLPWARRSLAARRPRPIEAAAGAE